MVSVAEGWWLPCKTDAVCGAAFDQQMGLVVRYAISAITMAALGIFNMATDNYFKTGRKRSTDMAPGNINGSMYYLNLAEQMDSEKCLQRVLCEASFYGRNKNSTNFQKAVANIGKQTLKQKVDITATIKNRKGGKLLYSIILGYKVKKVSKCKNLSKTCVDKSRKLLNNYMEELFKKEFGGNGTAVTTQEEVSTVSVTTLEAES